jgi:hypothetical protein
MGWLNTVLSVGRLAGQVLTMLPVAEAADEQAEQGFQPGGIKAYMNHYRGAAIQNITGGPIGLNFTSFINDADSKGQSSQLVHLDQPGDVFYPDQILETFVNGNVAIFDHTTQQQANGTILSVVRFFATLISGMSPTSVAGGVKIGLRRTDGGGYEVYFELGADINVKQVNMSLSTPQLAWQAGSQPSDTYYRDSEALVFPAPPAADGSQGVQVEGTVTMDLASYKALAAANAALVHHLG